MFFFAVFLLVVLTVVVFLSTEARGSYYDFFYPSLSSAGCSDVSLMLFKMQVSLFADYLILLRTLCFQLHLSLSRS